jgi:hypothetical protein
LSQLLPLPHRLALALYPPSFRDRYSEELRSLVEDSLPCRGMVWDLAYGAALAWLRPQFRGISEQRQRGRMLASILTVFCAWSVVLISVVAFNHSVADPRIPGLGQPVAHVAFEVSQIAIRLATVVIVLGGVVYWFAIVLRARRVGQRGVLRPAILPVLVVMGWLGATLFLEWWVLHFANGYHLPPLSLGAVLTLVLLWLVVSAACVPVCWVSIAMAMRRAELDLNLLRPGLAGAGLVVPILLVVVFSMAVTVVAMGTSGHLPATWGDVVFGYGVVPVAAAAALVAVVSGTRGVSSLRGTPPISPH